MENKKRIIITGGGTGGHIFPGIAIARELSGHPEAEVLYVGKKEGLESKWVPDAGFAFEGIEAAAFPRGFSVRLLTFWFALARSLAQAWGIVGRFRPDAVFSTGGYVSVPLSLAAALRGRRVALFEPNVAPGLAARLLGLFSRRIFTGFEGTVKRFSKRRTQWTGIPVREEITSAEKGKALEGFGLRPGVPTLLMLGGSQGAFSLNRVMADVLKFLGDGDRPVQAILMTGWADYRRTVDRLEKCGLKTVIRPFLSNIHEAYAAADLVVARSGAMTCAETISRGLPAVFIPYPHASGHQEMNARALEAAGSAVVITEKELSEESLTRMLISLLSDEGKRGEMGEKARRLDRPDAARVIAGELLSLAEKGEK